MIWTCGNTRGGVKRLMQCNGKQRFESRRRYASRCAVPGRRGRVVEDRKRIERDRSRSATGTPAPPRPLRGSKTRPACMPSPLATSRLHTGAGRREAADSPSSPKKRGVSRGPTHRRRYASAARRAEAPRISERARAWRARSERPVRRPPAHHERTTTESRLCRQQPPRDRLSVDSSPRSPSRHSPAPPLSRLTPRV